jgi:hypothetical protein
MSHSSVWQWRQSNYLQATPVLCRFVLRALRMQLTHTHTSANDGKFQWHRSRLMRTAIHSVTLILSAGMRVSAARCAYIFNLTYEREIVYTHKNSASRKKSEASFAGWLFVESFPAHWIPAIANIMHVRELSALTQPGWVESECSSLSVCVWKDRRAPCAPTLRHCI